MRLGRPAAHPRSRPAIHQALTVRRLDDVRMTGVAAALSSPNTRDAPGSTPPRPQGADPYVGSLRRPITRKRPRATCSSVRDHPSLPEATRTQPIAHRRMRGRAPEDPTRNDRLPTPGGAHHQRRLRLVCSARIDGDQPTIHSHGALVGPVLRGVSAADRARTKSAVSRSRHRDDEVSGRGLRVT